MKRRKKKKPSATPADRDALDDFLGEKKPALTSFLEEVKPKKATRSKAAMKGKASLERAINNAKIRAADGDWDDAKPRDFIGLFALCHDLVYGITPIELEDQTEMRKAGRYVKKCFEVHFESDPIEFVEFIKWTWERQKGKEAWALRNGRTINRLNHWIQFSPALVSDFRREQVKRSRRKK